MGKPFSDDEKESIKSSLVSKGLELFRNQGLKEVSIRTLTQAAGIAQGGFYTFFKDKEDFILYLIELRVSQKLDERRNNLSSSLTDPFLYLSDFFYKEGMHLKDNKAFNTMISDSMSFYFSCLSRHGGSILGCYKKFFDTLETYWNAHGISINLNIDGLIALLHSSLILFMNASLIDDAFFKQIFRTTIDANLKNYVSMEM